MTVSVSTNASDALFVKDAPFDCTTEESEAATFCSLTACRPETGSLGLDTNDRPSHGCIWSEKKKLRPLLMLIANGQAAKMKAGGYQYHGGATAKMAEAAMSVFQDAGIPWLSTALQLKTF